MPGVGFEPTRPYGQRILSPPRLPIPSPGRNGRRIREARALDANRRALAGALPADGWCLGAASCSPQPRLVGRNVAFEAQRGLTGGVIALQLTVVRREVVHAHVARHLEFAWQACAFEEAAGPRSGLGDCSRRATRTSAGTCARLQVMLRRPRPSMSTFFLVSWPW